MKAKLHLVFSITIIFSCFYVHGQQVYWKSISKQSHLKSVSIKDMAKAKKVFTLDRGLFSKEVGSMSSSKGKQMVYLPGADGEVVPFYLEETPVFHPDLAKKYPEIKSYTGVSPDGRLKIKLSSSPKGLEGMVVDLGTHKKTFMEPVSNAVDTYVVYDEGAGATEKDNFICETEKSVLATAKTIVPLVDDQVLRKFRIAVSTTGEYTSFHGGTVAGALAAINATITRVNEVFETDLGTGGQ
jgi:hypothetical protein